MNINFQKYFNLSSLSPQQQAIVVNALTDLTLARLADMVADHLSEEEIAQLEAAGASKDPQAVIDWLNSHVPNFSQGINEILQEESAQLATQITALTNYAVGG